MDDFISTCTVSCIDSKKYNNYYCVTCKFSWIVCQTCFHIQFVLQFFNIQRSICRIHIYDLSGIKHLYLTCILSVWLVIAWWSLLWSLIHICWISALKVDPIWTRGGQRKKYSQKGPWKYYFWLHFLIEDVSVDKYSKKSQWPFLF